VSNKDLQIINDEILCYKQSLSEVEDKLNLLKFLNGVDDSIGRNLNLDCNELLFRKKHLEKNLRKLLEEKSKLTNIEEEDGTDDLMKIPAKKLNSLYISNYLSFLYNFNDENISGKKETNNL
jgi:ABC-type phosphate transport system auxiliary subunit